MKGIAMLCAATIAAVLTAAGPAWAQLNRSFVSGQGMDTNPCSLAMPCRTFAQAILQTNAGGEIVALDSAGYGPLTITKAITVTAIGIEASITSNSATAGALTINASPNDTVTVRGLTLIGGAVSNYGIEIDTAKSVTIRDTSVTGFAFLGIFVDPSANLNVELRGVSVENNGDRGIYIIPAGSSNLTMLVTDSNFNGNGNNDGISLHGDSTTGKINATFNVNVANNNGAGVFLTNSPPKAQMTVMITGSKVVNNLDAGLIATGTMQVFVDSTQITGNGVSNASMGWTAVNNAVVSSYKNNSVNGNGTDGLNGVVQISSE